MSGDMLPSRCIEAGAAPIAALRLSLEAGGRELVRELDWQAQAGERWCVIGRNGAGKSTLLRALAGLALPRQQGEVRWLGRAALEWPAADAARLRAYMPQQTADRFPMTVAQLLSLASPEPMPIPMPTRAPATGARPDIPAVLDALDAAHLLERRVTQLSGGERQRVALAQCAVQSARAMLLDEPASSQDPAHRRVVSEWLRAQAAQAIVVCTHDVDWVARTATHVLMLTGDGRWESGPVDEMLNGESLASAFGCAWRLESRSWQPS